MSEKKCFKCGVLKSLSEFYRHPAMADGTVNKCKDCNKKDVKANYTNNIQQPGYIDKERKRGREKFRRLYSGTIKQKTGEANHRFYSKFPEKLAAKKYSTSKLVPPGFEGHHWSYNDDHVKDVIPLTKREHGKAHRFLVYDQERMMYRRYNTNELLDTREKHETFIRWCISNLED
jgi:hypothetical protein